MDHWYAFLATLFAWCFVPNFLSVVRRGRRYMLARIRRPTPHWRAELKARQQLKRLRG